MKRGTAILVTLVAFPYQADLGRAEDTYNVKGSGACVATVKMHSSTDMDIKSENIVWITSGGERFDKSYAGTCQGPGKMEKEVYSGQLNCFYQVGSKGTYTLKVNDEMKGGTLELTGGTGMFKGAKGQGSFTYTWTNSVGDRCLYDWELKFVIP
jgi:hypothetical protein